MQGSHILQGFSYFAFFKNLRAPANFPTNKKKTKKYPSYSELEENIYLILRTGYLNFTYKNCHLCPLDHRADKTKGDNVVAGPLIKLKPLVVLLILAKKLQRWSGNFCW